MTVFGKKVVLMPGSHLKRGHGWFVCRMSLTGEGRNFDVLEGPYRRESYAHRRRAKLAGERVDEEFIEMVARNHDGEVVGR